MPINRKWRPWKTQYSRTQSQQTETQTNTEASGLLGRWFNRTWLGHLLLGVWAISGAIAASTNWSLGQSMERQTQEFFFQLRGSVKPPNNIVILA
ncbi:MAG TPA: protein kinase, partial [Cyanobacteria bacterium UBA8543]|nr:protein kinase [Cyanobacteria bacterium UBA8543]